MNNRFLLALAATASLLLTAVVRADGMPDAVSVYLSPDANALVFQRLAPGDPHLAAAKPVPDADKAAQGWQMAELDGPFMGFVPTDKAKDGTVAAGAPVHLSMDDVGPVMGNAAETPALAVKTAGAVWSTVSFPGPLTVYFIKPASKAVAAPAPVAATPPAAIMAPAPALAPAPAPTPVNVTAVPVVSAATPPITVTAVPATKLVDPSAVPNFYYGKLALRTDPKIGGPTNAQYVLYGDKGQVIALVDLNNVVLPNPLVAYLEKTVKIYGRAYPGRSAPYPIIFALTVQAQ